jgi:hypothetical protein
LDPLFFLECLLHREDLIFWFKVEGLFAACESFDKDLLFGVDIQYGREQR